MSRIYLVIQFPRPLAIITDRAARPLRTTDSRPAIFLPSAHSVPLERPRYRVKRLNLRAPPRCQARSDNRIIDSRSSIKRNKSKAAVTR
ncbi:hypothetical protein PUN28_000250 [Cardiocondyla obscurior]|uniref:Uncharacterized protein n=1 Tax=Cardiocondyla obscurior TaxID=286306 RepID=A0AAW2GYR5_9HYME